MPNDPHRDWLRLHTKTVKPADGHAFHLFDFPLDKIEGISAGEFLVQLLGGRLFPELSDEPFQC